MKRTHKMLAALAAGVMVAGTVAGVSLASTDPGPANSPSASSLAASAARALVDDRPAALHASAHDRLVEGKTYSGAGAQYVSYTRTYKGLPVIGGDFVVVTDNTGRITSTSVAQTRAIGELSTKATLAAAKAKSIAAGTIHGFDRGLEPTLVVYALGGTARLAWQADVAGRDEHGAMVRAVYVDAKNGDVLGSRDLMPAGSGNAGYSGPNPVQLATSQSGSTYSLKDPNYPTLVCQDAANNTTFSGPDDSWGNGDPTNRETGCVDALYASQQQQMMLSQWLGRNGLDGNGGAWPIRVGLDDVNAYYCPSNPSCGGLQVQIGHNQDSPAKWIAAMDVVAHENGHGIDDHTPGGISQGGTQEFIADVFGSAVEGFDNQPAEYDPPDYTIGEEVNLVGRGPIRYMYKPSTISGHPDCYSSSVPTLGVHAASGPGNHWFYLLAEGTNPTNGQPTSTTCNGSTNLTGIGVQNAMKIVYNAMLMKTSSSSYLKYRTWTLTAAKNLDATCNLYNKTKAAWNAVSVPAQADEPSCTGGTPSPTPTASPTGTPSPTPTGTPGCTVTNGTDVTIPDNTTVESSVTVSGCSGNASATSTVAVNIQHTYIGDLVVSLVAPDGSAYTLHNRTGSGTDNINQTYTVNLSGEVANGTWKLRVQDAASQDTGKIDTWTLNLGGGASPTPTGTPGCSGTNGNDVAIPDNTTVESSIAISGCSGNASATSKVAVNIVHTYIGDLVVSLVAPDGSVYTLHNRTGSGTDNINQTYTVNLSSEVRNGTWKLRVQDAASQDTGRIDTWTLTL